LSEDRSTTEISFENWLRSYPWLSQRDLPCIISADLDGISCGLLQQEAFGWNVIGTYDGELLCTWTRPEQIDWDEIVFIDVEIMRPTARSIGNHLLAVDADCDEVLRKTLTNCVNPNLWRRINAWNSFQRKFPFSTLPLLVSSRVLQNPDYRVSHEWLALVLQTDSSFTNAAQYQKNALDWLEVMGMNSGPSPLRHFCGLLAKIPAQTALRLVADVQEWASDAGFGSKQRACRFDPSNGQSLERACKLAANVREVTGSSSALPFTAPPVHVERLQTAKMHADSLGRLRQSVNAANKDRVVSMAITARTAEGFSYTKSVPSSACPLFR
jgi:hypothetical protein